MEYKLGGGHPQDLASGRMVEPGETVDLTEEEIEDPHNKALIESGLLTSIKDLEAMADEEPSATEAASQAAHRLNIDLKEVGGTGAGGKITREDVEQFASQREGGESK